MPYEEEGVEGGVEPGMPLVYLSTDSRLVAIERSLGIEGALSRLLKFTYYNPNDIIAAQLDYLNAGWFALVNKRRRGEDVLDAYVKFLIGSNLNWAQHRASYRGWFTRTLSTRITYQISERRVPFEHRRGMMERLRGVFRGGET